MRKAFFAASMKAPIAATAQQDRWVLSSAARWVVQSAASTAFSAFHRVAIAIVITAVTVIIDLRHLT